MITYELIHPHPQTKTKSQVHAISHPQLEAPLLLAAHLLVQAALTTASERRRRVKPRRGGRSTDAKDARGADSPTTTHISTSASNSPRSRDGGESESAAAAAASGGGGQFLVGGDARDTAEAAAVGQLMEAFPRGRLREGSKLAPDAVVVQESWTLLARALEAMSRGGFSAAAAAAARDGSGCVVDPEEFPLLLSERVHADMVRGLAANLIEVEVRT